MAGINEPGDLAGYRICADDDPKATHVATFRARADSVKAQVVVPWVTPLKLERIDPIGIDYRLLLMKYMNVVGEAEGTTFMGGVYEGNCGLTKAEAELLHILDKESTNVR